MKKTVLITFLMGIFFACQSSRDNVDEVKDSTDLIDTKVIPSDDIVMGAERLTSYLPTLMGKRVALVVNQTSVINGSHLVDTFGSIGVNVVKVFAPEHGFRGNHSAGAVIKDGKDQKSGLPVVSLYGRNKKPTAEMLKDVDVVVFDIQDVGVRFYTYISTMHYVMEACAELGKKVVVLDRPNPNGFYVDGPILDKEFKSFIGMHAIPLVHGLTVGELALMINGEKWLKNEVVCDLQVVTCGNYGHNVLYELPIWPSPNLPNMNYLYPYLGLFEGTNVSIGRGTNKPFQIVGRPGEEGDYSFTPVSIPGVSKNPKHLGKVCIGYEVNDVLDSSLFNDPKLNLSHLISFYKSNKSENGIYFRDFFYKLAGNKELRTQIEQGMSEDEIRKTWQPKLEEYKRMRKKYLLY
ncbi:MAG: exo-beta-N-acetylmuramidase NamZ family protein [Bacteroidia bacterium]